MGYPIIDVNGILEPAANNMFVLNGNMSNLKKIQALFYTNVVFFIINSLKTKQKFMSNRIFELLPDITKMKSFPSKINDESLYDFFDFNKDSPISFPIRPTPQSLSLFFCVANIILFIYFLFNIVLMYIPIFVWFIVE